jgi:hypothetical protein
MKITQTNAGDFVAKLWKKSPKMELCSDKLYDHSK